MGEASHPGPHGRRTRDVSDAVLDNLEHEFRLIESDDEPLVRSTSGQNVVPRISSWEAIGESLATVPASPVALEAAGRSCAEVVTIFHSVPSTVPAQTIPTWVDRDDECSVSSESCWGDQEDLIGDESFEWGLLSGPEVHTVPDEDGSIAPVVYHSERLPSQRVVSRRVVLVPQSPGGTPQSVQDLHGTQVELAARSPQPEISGGVQQVHRELLASRDPPRRLRSVGVPSTVPEPSSGTNVIPSGRFSVLSEEMEISTVPNDRNSADTQRVEFGANGESDTQTVPSMDGESGASAASGDDPGEMWTTWNQVLRIWHPRQELCELGSCLWMQSILKNSSIDGPL